MAKVIIAGNSVVIKSEVSLEDLKMIQRFAPDTLKKKDKDGNEIYGVCFASKGCGNLTKYGPTFDAMADMDGKAIITIPFPDCSKSYDKKEYAADQYAQYMADLNDMELAVLESADTIRKNRDDFMRSIGVAD